MMMSLNKPVFPRIDYYDSFSLENEYSVLKEPKNSASFKPMNIILIIVESLGREPVGVFNKRLDNGNYNGYTPFLDSLAEHSYIFVNSYANSRRSIEGSPAVLASIPSLQESFTLSNYSGNNINTLASLLKSKGYYTAFFHGAPNGSLGLNSFAVQAGVDHYYGLNEYNNNKDFDGVWGIWDHLFLPYAINTMDSFEKPFISEIFTVSSHHPYKIPEGIEQLIPDGKIKMHKSIGYADYSLREFINTAKTKEWYNNTLFVITGDHTCTPYFPEYQTSVGAYTVPIILFKPGDKLVGLDSTTAQQIDIMPTILSYLNYDLPYIAFGEDLLHPSKEKFAVSYFGNAFQLIMDNWVILYDLKDFVGLYSLKDDPLMKNNLINTGVSMQVKMEKKIKAVIQQYNNRMIDNRLTYP
jgi:phosphoglycerol transferase MdoB-like AlkP superfamily enzyme